MGAKHGRHESGAPRDSTKAPRDWARWRLVAGLVAAFVVGAGLVVGIVWTPLGLHKSPTQVAGGSSLQSIPQTSPPATVSPSPPPSPDLLSLVFPIRAAFYYPWFPEAWRQQGMDPFTHYRPALGYYETNSTTVKGHVQAMQYAGIRAGIVSWWGQKSTTDGRIAMLLQVAAVTGFEWALYYEPEGQADPPVSGIASDLAYIRDRYAGQPGYLRVGGRPVLFVYADANDSCGMAQRWKQANTLGFYVVLKVFPGYRTCANQPDGWHQYAPANAEDNQAGSSFTISPGFWKATESSARLSRDPSRWTRSIDDMVASRAPWQLVTTFNEWGEGTAIEDASQWHTASGYGVYLDALHRVS